MSFSLDHLKVNTTRLSDEIVAAYLVGAIKVAGHGKVTVVVHPRPDQNLEDFGVLREGEQRSQKLISKLANILESGQEQIKKKLSEYCPDCQKLSPTALITGLRLACVKIDLSGQDELILNGNTYYHGLDLNLLIKPNLRVAKAWLDG